MNPIPQQPGEPEVIRRRWPSAIWLVPAIALLIGASMLLHAWLAAGPEIAISFQTATGLEPGKTAVKYKDVTVGIVKDTQLRGDDSQVLVTVSLNESAANLARADTRFWVVRPRVGIGGVTGIDTLLSGAYIGVDKGSSALTRSAFTGLESPPAIINDMPGSRFVVQTDDLGSLDIGSPVYYRQGPVGRIASYQLNADGKSVSLQIFIDAPYDRFVTPNALFPNNWIALLGDGSLFTFPMEAENRRRERRQDIIAQLAKDFVIERRIDLSAHELAGRFLEGTGSLILDHPHKLAYACLSSRSSPEVGREFERHSGYKIVWFDAVDRHNQPIYHTNVM